MLGEAKARLEREYGVPRAVPRSRTSGHRTPTNACERRWRGFVFNPQLRERPCSCWVKVGTGRTSLDPSAKNYGKPWFFIHLRHGHVSSFYFSHYIV